VALTVKEPRAQPAANTPGAAPAIADFGDVLRALSNKPTFWLAAASAGFLAFVGYGHLFFIQSFFLRSHGPEIAALAAPFGLKAKGFLGIATGLMIGGGGFVGTLLGGAIADHAATRDRRRHMSVPALASLAALPVLVLIFTLPSAPVAIALIFVVNALGTLWYGPFYSTAQSVVAQRHRATAAALLLLVLNLIGLGLGPPFVGALSDFLATREQLGAAEGLRWSMIITAFVSLISVALLLAARHTVRRDVVS
jgi:MFS family permease